MYSMNMSQEHKKVMLPEGWRNFKILSCREDVAKSSGNKMFVFMFLDTDLNEEVEIYATAVEKRRWFLKQILGACNVAASADGVYDWDIPDVLDKNIRGRIERYQEDWINKENKTVKVDKWKISKVESMGEGLAETTAEPLGPSENIPIFNEEQGTVE